MIFRHKKFLFIPLIAMILASCGGGRAILWHDKNATQASIEAGKAAYDQPDKPKAVVPIFIATSRAREDTLYMPFGSKRSPNLNFARVDVGIPKTHKKGMVEKNGHKPNPGRHFAAVAMQSYNDKKAFKDALNAALAKLPPEEKEITVFIHGYNNNFAESTFRAAQIAYDYETKSVFVHYSWPSGGSLGLYVYDRDSADFGRDGLVELLKTVADTQAKEISVVAHSMGNFVTMEALRTLALRGDRRPIDRITSLLLAAPDIDVDLFQRQLKDIGKMPNPTAVQVSRKDTALTISGTLTGGHHRVGDGSDSERLEKQGIIVLDMSDVDGGDHGVFASSPTLMALVKDGALSHSTLAGDGQKPGDAILADSSSVVQGATSLILFTPQRILSSVPHK